MIYYQMLSVEFSLCILGLSPSSGSWDNTGLTSSRIWVMGRQLGLGIHTLKHSLE